MGMVWADERLPLPGAARTPVAHTGPHPHAAPGATETCSTGPGSARPRCSTGDWDWDWDWDAAHRQDRPHSLKGWAGCRVLGTACCVLFWGRGRGGRAARENMQPWCGITPATSHLGCRACCQTVLRTCPKQAGAPSALPSQSVPSPRTCAWSPLAHPSPSLAALPRSDTPSTPLATPWQPRQTGPTDASRPACMPGA